jgi:hypothetical protein
MTQVWQRLFIGERGDAEALSRANPHGISTVLTLSKRKVTKSVSGVNYLYFPLETSGPMPAARFDQIIDAIAENIRWGSILLQSHTGQNRSPVLAAAWMDVVGAKEISAGLEEIRERGPITPNRRLVKSVKELLR